MLLQLTVTRIALAVSALAGRLDHVADAAKALDSAREVEARLRRAISIETKQTRYWYGLWHAASMGHQQAQAIMATDIDTLVAISSEMVGEIAKLREKLKIGQGPDWSARIAKYKEAPYMEMMEKYRETFVNAKHPDEVRVPPSPTETG